MEREQIISKVRSLPVHDWGEDDKYPYCPNPQVDGLWRDFNQEYGTTIFFELLKQQGAVPVWQNENNRLTLTLKGETRRGERRLVKDFVAALGKPSEETVKRNGPRIVVWERR